MAILKRQQDLRGQVPEDVRERARRAGVESFDWYAGRLDTAEEEGGTEAPPSERRSLEEAAERHREEARDDHEPLMSRMRALMQRLHLRPAR